VIVDSDADLDEVVPAVIASAFGFAGQKCSACSRVLVHEAVVNRLVERLAGAASVLRVGQAEDFSTEVPPVIERAARDRLTDLTAQAESGGRLVSQVADVPADGWFVPPTVAAGLDPGASLLQQEVFGPLMTVESVSSVEAACDVIDSLPFALTGGLFSRSPSVVREVAQRSPVGNLYVNRGVTGAMVGRQPFGGNRLSGIGSKAGGPDYLLQFCEPRVVTQNVMRHGLVVD